MCITVAKTRFLLLQTLYGRYKFHAVRLVDNNNMPFPIQNFNSLVIVLLPGVDMCCDYIAQKVLCDMIYFLIGLYITDCSCTGVTSE